MTSENEVSRMAQALADVATDEDKLFHDGFVKGISEFIKECPTPMTIAIQGDWGVGKTSLMNLIKSELQVKVESEESDDSDVKEYCEDIVNVATVDVWQQSIANPDISIFQILLGEMVAGLSGDDLSSVKNASELISVAASILDAVASGEDNGEDLDEGHDEDDSFGSILCSIFGLEDDKKSEKSEKSKSENEFISVEDINTFQTSFTELLQQSAKDADKSDDSRFVVFIDGLDCINPEAAIDLMERVRTYVECPRCVFVLAVDEKTVFEGAKKKFGEKADEGRKKMLFDRYIQVPLRIPICAFNLDKYIKELLKDEKELSGEFAEVIGTLLNVPAPRRIKRCINTMHLYRNTFGELDSTGGGSLAMLLAAVILKAESTQGFDAVANCAEGDEAHFAEKLKVTLEPLGLDSGIKWAKLPTLWSGGKGADEDAAKRDAFISWIRKLK